MSNDLGSELYSGAATYGRINAIIGSIFGTIIGVLMILGGIGLIKRKTKRDKTVKATITNDTDCYGHSENNNTTWNCNLSLAYNIDGKDYTTSISSSSSIKYEKGNTVTLYYNPDNVSEIDLVSDNTHIIGWVVLVIGIFLLISTWVWLYIVYKSKFAAASGGVAALAGNISHAIH